MGAGARSTRGEVPSQPSMWSSGASKARRDEFASAYAPVSNGRSGTGSTGGSGGGANPFEIYDAELDDAGADDGMWEAEAVGARSEARPWQPRFYNAYFDVNAGDIAVRLVRSVLPFKPLLGWAAHEEEEDGGTPVPDLYGPVWVTTTAVLALAVGSSVASFLRNVFHGTETREISQSLAGLDFSRLWRAACVLYFYVFVFPVIITVFQCLFVRNSLRESSASAYPVLGAIMVYGYAMTPIVIAALVATVPMRIVQVSAMGTAFVLGAGVIGLNLWRDVAVEHWSLTFLVRAMAAIAHAAVGVALVWTFYR